jgi:WD40 repeat protein
MLDVQPSHPAAEVLRAFGLGTLGAAERQALEDHIAACPTCCAGLAQVAPDTLVSLLQHRDPTQHSAPTAAPSGDGRRTGGSPEDAEARLPVGLAEHPRYRIVRALGAGGMGAVYQAEHRLMGRTVALKVIRPGLVDQPAAVERFQREVRAAARLAHPNIVASYDAEQTGAIHFLVMEYVAGTTLAELVRQRGPLPVAEACDYARQAALGLQHAHEQGMVHRDIKPQNLMRTTTGRVKVLDFGLARLAREAAAGEAGSGLTSANALMGTPDYVAPEQANDARSADIRADLYSLGCTLYHLLSGRVPFPGGTHLQKVLAHLERAPQPVAELRPGLPPGLAAVVERLLAKDPARRYPTPAAVAEALAPFTSPETGPTPEPRRPRGRLVVAVAAGLLAALGLAGAVYRIATDTGELVIETVDPNVEVVIKQGGRQVSIVDGRTNWNINLRSGRYELELAGGKEGLALSANEFTLRRGDRETVHVRLLPKGDAAGPIAGAPAPVAGAPAQPGGLVPLRVFAGHEDIVWSVVFSADGRWLLTSGGDTYNARGYRVRGVDYSIRLWEVNTGRQVQIFRGHTATVYSCGFSPDGRQVISCSEDQTLRLWDVATGNELRQIQAHADDVADCDFALGDRKAVTVSYDGLAKLWDLGTGAEIRRMAGHAEEIRCLAVSPDGRRILSAGGKMGGKRPRDAAIHYWDLETGKELGRCKGHREAVGQVRFLPDGRRAVSGSYDGTMRLWDLNTFEEVRRYEGHRGGIGGVVITADGRRILSGGSDDGTVRLWDLESGRQLARTEPMSEGVYTVGVSPDGRLGVSGGPDRMVRLWQLP